MLYERGGGLKLATQDVHQAISSSFAFAAFGMMHGCRCGNELTFIEISIVRIQHGEGPAGSAGRLRVAS